MEQYTDKAEEHNLLNDGEVNQLLGTGPSKIVILGNTILLALIISLGFLAWYIKIPETINGFTTLKPIEAGQLVTTNEDIVIANVFKKNGDLVKPGDTLYTGNNAQTILANTSGKVVYLKQIYTGEKIVAGTQMMAVTPLKTNLDVSAFVPLSAYCKVKLGQKVMISLSGQEFGGLEKITGEVQGLRIPKHGEKYGTVEIKIDQKLSEIISTQGQILYPVSGLVNILYKEASLFNLLFQS
ncbi:HlyD family efflux transporter periplasmic adaptor subunit [Pedobacter sp. AW1-32]|uniref:HlyD family efflux transporter periplasmic adaptor subunit n=1 Tax=Pedobacter sp. AW1-32 TaxID=3383026 RepID=UPI003FEDAF85